MCRTALVTGGTGFTGSHLVRRLVDNGWLVHVIVRESSSLDALAVCKDAIRCHVHDGTTANMIEIMRKSEPDIVFHLAAFIRAEHAAEDIVPMLRTNLIFASQLVEAMAVCQVRKLINTGTFWEHFENRDSPTCLYAATKHAFESILQYYVDVKGFNVITLKLFDNFGPRDPRSKLFSFLARAAEEEQELLMSPGMQLLDLVYIDDVIEAYMVAGARLINHVDQGHKRYAISSGNQLSLREVVSLYEELSGSKLPIRWGGRPYRSREVMVPWNNGEVLPGWKPNVSIREGISLLLSEEE